MIMHIFDVHWSFAAREYLIESERWASSQSQNSRLGAQPCQIQNARLRKWRGIYKWKERILNKRKKEREKNPEQLKMNSDVWCDWKRSQNLCLTTQAWMPANRKGSAWRFLQQLFSSLHAAGGFWQIPPHESRPECKLLRDVAPKFVI